MNWRLYIIFCCFLSTTALGNDVPDEVKTKLDVATQYADAIIPLLNDVSAAWKVEALLPHLATFAYDTNEKMSLLKAMVSNAASIGKFKTCNSLKTGVLNGFRIKKNVAISGFCEFEKGNAEVTFVFVKENESFATYMFMVFPK